MESVKEIAVILVPILFAGLLFFMHRYVSQGDKMFSNFLPLQTQIAVMHRDVGELNDLKADLKEMMNDLFDLSGKVEKVLTLREDFERMTNQIDKLKLRDDMLWDELRKKHPQ